jgi:DNA repair protein RadC
MTIATVSHVRELRLVYSPREQTGPLQRVGRPADAAAVLRERLEHEAVEVAVVLLLNTKHRLIAIHEIGRGTVDQCIVTARDVYKAALLANAAAVIVAHNHPSGDPSPSSDDRALCGQLEAAGRLIGVELIDFLVIGEDGHYCPFRENGHLQPADRSGAARAAGGGR